MSTAPVQVYLIEAEMGLVKIGSSSHPQTRLKALAGSSPSPLRLIAQWPGGLLDERALQARFYRFRSHNEWFRIEGPVLEFVEAARGRGVDFIPPWSALYFEGAAEKRKASRISQAAKMKALWASPHHRESLRRAKAARDEARAMWQAPR